MVDDSHDIVAFAPFIPTVSQKEFKKKNTSEPSSSLMGSRGKTGAAGTGGSRCLFDSMSRKTLMGKSVEYWSTGVLEHC
jgi:hypothetical protein